MAAPGEKLFCVLEYHTSKSVVTVQRAFRAKYAKNPPTDKTIRAWYKQFTETGCLCKQKSSGSPPLKQHHPLHKPLYLQGGHSEMRSDGLLCSELW